MLGARWLPILETCDLWPASRLCGLERIVCRVWRRVEASEEAGVDQVGWSSVYSQKGPRCWLDDEDWSRVCDCLISIVDDCFCLIKSSLLGNDGVNCGIVDHVRNELSQDSLSDDYTRPVSLGIFDI